MKRLFSGRRFSVSERGSLLHLVAMGALVASAMPSSAAETDLVVSLADKLPTCPAEYPVDLTTVGGGTTTKPVGDFYCVIEPYANPQQGRPVLAGLKSEISSLGHLTRIKLSSYYFQDQLPGKWLCSLPIGRSTEIELFAQRSSPETEESHLTAEFLDTLAECAGRITINYIGCDFTNEKNTCPNRQTNTHHIKAASFEGKAGTVYAVGSGNFTFHSLVRNIEHWVSVKRRDLSSIARFDCLFTLLGELSEYPALTYRQQSDIYDGCIATDNSMDEARLYVLPFQSRDFVGELTRLVRRSERVTIAAQFIESETIFNLIESNPTVHFVALVDSAYYYSGYSNPPKGYNFIDPKKARFLLDLSDRLENFELRYLQTNHHYDEHGQTNTVHLRTILFEQQGRVDTMIGSSHLRDGSWRSNTEQQLFLYGPAFSEQHDFVADLLARSATPADIPAANVDAKPIQGDRNGE